MQKHNIAGTDISVSLLGLGTVKLGRNTGVKYPQSFAIPSDGEALEILKVASNNGINLIDTAPAYGNSEERLGELLPKINQQWVICTKVGEVFDPKTSKSYYDFSPEHIEQSITNSLKKLRRDKLDIVLIHSNGEDEKIIRDGALDCLNHLKEKGLIRATGMSTKTVSGGIMAANHSDIVMVTHNLEYQEEAAVIDYAYQNNKGVFIKKALASGHTAHNANNNAEDRVSKSFECIFQQKGISSIILGSINPTHIKDNADKAIAAYNSLKTK